MRLALRQTESPSAPSGAPDAIGAWLERLLRLARLPARASAELRDELDAHLRERVRDLMLAGHEEPDAIHKAIAELGDLALLAHRYRDAHRTPKGRLIMHTMLVTAVATALGLSSLALRQSERPALPPAEIAASPAEAPPLLGDVPMLRHYFSAAAAERARAGNQGGSDAYLVARNAEGEPLEHVLSGFGESSDSKVFVYWGNLNQHALDRDTELPSMPLEGQTVERALRMLSNVLELDGASRLDYRVENGLMEIATNQFFTQRDVDLDQRDLELVSYDAAELLGAETPLDRGEASETLIELVTTMVEPEMWERHGGFATISAAGNRLFVNAPSRMHAKVAWLLAELMQGGEAHGARERALRDFLASSLVDEPSHANNPQLLGELLGHAAAKAEDAPPQARHILRDAVAELSDARHFIVQHTASSELAEALNRALAPIGGTATADAARNMLVVTGGARAHDIAEAMLRALDLPSAPEPCADEAEPAEPESGRGRGERIERMDTTPPTSRPDVVRISARDGRVLLEIDAASGGRQRLTAAADGVTLETIAADGTRQVLQASEIELVAGEAVRATSLDAAPPSGAPTTTSLRPSETGARTCLVRAGDSLETLAAREIGDPGAARDILALNPGVDSHALRVGQRIRLD